VTLSEPGDYRLQADSTNVTNGVCKPANSKTLRVSEASKPAAPSGGEPPAGGTDSGGSEPPAGGTDPGGSEPPAGPTVKPQALTSHDLLGWKVIKPTKWVGAGEVTLEGQDYSVAFYYTDGVYNEAGYMSFPLQRRCTVLQGVLGISDGSPAGSRGEIAVYVDGANQRTWRLQPATAEFFEVDLRGASVLRVEFRATGGGELSRYAIAGASMQCRGKVDG